MKEARKNGSKQKKWIKKRHSVIRAVAGVLMKPVLKHKYHIKIEKFDEKPQRQYLILFNHQTPADQFFVSLSFKKPVYYVASEDIFSNGLISKLLRFAAAPVPIKKFTGDARAVLTCVKIASEGGTIAMAPEGNRTYSGRTCYIMRSVVPFVRKLKLPVLLYRIEGGYGAEPRWSSCVRKGSMRSYVFRVIEPEEYEQLSDDELYTAIKEGLFVDEGKAEGIYISGKKAEYIERAAYVCPFCGLSVFESEKNCVTCTKCGRTVEYGEDKRLSGKGFDFPFEFYGEWYDYQNSFVKGLEADAYTAEPMFRDKADLYRVNLYKNKERTGRDVEISLFSDRIELSGGGAGASVIPFSEVSATTVLGRNKLNIYHGKNTLQIRGGKRFNALKYVNMYYKYRSVNKKTGEEYGEFLGL